MKGNLTATKQVASIVGQSVNAANINISKAYFSDTKFTTSETTNNAFIGNGQGNIILNETFYASEHAIFYRDYEGGSNLTPNQGIAKLDNEITLTWFNTLGFNELFKYEDNDIKLNRVITKEASKYYFLMYPKG